MATPERYFVDENTLSIALALCAVRPDVVYPGHPDLPEVPPGTHDEDWLPIIGPRGWPIIMRDKRIRRKPVERQRLIEAGAKAFCLTAAGNKTSWEILQLVVRRWDEMVEIASTVDGPFIYALTDARLAPLSLDSV